ncbi:hypothetical protein CIHG_04556 [Coccidioides immitis H538.4]|uniref:AB hydrolase-1 domain-containing protein n=2 Tax=Coccidioides immitis TaxID=5501 RepID=A0A0J8R1F1_COCIT|nr:hypothetical protein CISG_07632 [Coccidioides immitis RMSCC 3703]KMU86767.1 hypothetical protein CIHG_04556 [Coccidioides immitis H538.4]
MDLIPPSYSFTIPSLYDAVHLECRLFHSPRSVHARGKRKVEKKAAIVAHPYAPLGGCFDDPIVGVITDELLQAGYVVGTFNLRGAGESQGRTSWTAKPELADYISFYGFVIHYMHNLLIEDGSQLSGEIRSPVEEDDYPSVKGEDDNMKLILSGYSFGSMLATLLPSAVQVVETFSSAEDDSSAMKIRRIALELAREHSLSIRYEVAFHALLPVFSRSQGILNARRPATPSGACNYQPESRVLGRIGKGVEKINPSPPDVHYLLVSPILPPVSLFVTMSFFASHKNLSTTVDGSSITGLLPEEALTSHRSLAIYGDSDFFTSIKKLRDWSRELSSKPNSSFEFLEIRGAGHFWRENGVEFLLKSAIRDFSLAR